MSDVPYVVHIPADLIERAKTAHLNLDQVVITALEKVLNSRERFSAQQRLLTPEEIDQLVAESAARIASGKVQVRKLGMHAGQGWISDDFDDPLPDDFWFRSDR